MQFQLISRMGRGQLRDGDAQQLAEAAHARKGVGNGPLRHRAGLQSLSAADQP